MELRWFFFMFSAVYFFKRYKTSKKKFLSYHSINKAEVLYREVCVCVCE